MVVRQQQLDAQAQQEFGATRLRKVIHELLNAKSSTKRARSVTAVEEQTQPSHKKARIVDSCKLCGSELHQRS